VDAMQLATVCEKLGAGEILLNCIDKDGPNSGFDIELVKHISESVTIPVIASSGAGKVEHFSEVFEKTNVEAALAAGIFHREEIPIEAVKKHMRDEGIETR
jgi:glutamine amidotransferase/cyclase